MVGGVFPKGLRYRSTLLPFARAGAAGGWALLARGEGSRGRGGLGPGCGGALGALVVGPFVGPGGRALRSLPALRAMRGAVEKGDPAAAKRYLDDAVRADPVAARPWLRYGRALTRQGDAAGALAAYDTARDRKGYVWVPTVVRPALLAVAGRTAEVQPAVEDANAFSWNVDPWLALEVAWRELPPPVADEIRLGAGDYGAARGFSNPFRDHRWTRHRAWLRVRPTAPAASYEVTLWMGSPAPSPHEAPVVRVTTPDGQASRCTLSLVIAPFRLRAAPHRDAVVSARL